MANVHRLKSGPDKGIYRIQGRIAGRPRFTLYLGKRDGKWAREVLGHVQELIEAKSLGGSVKRSTEIWLANAPAGLVEKLSAVGLVEERPPETLAAFVDGYIDRRTDVKPSTKITFQNVRRLLVQFFGSEKAMRDITAGHAEQFRLSLSEEESCRTKGRLARATISKRLQIAKQIFENARKFKVIDANPFAGMKKFGKQSNPERTKYVTVDLIERAISLLPKCEEKALLAFARYAGLRIPSEIRLLRWEHIQWSRHTMLIHSPKTEHHEGKDKREVPIFARLRPYIDALQEYRQPDTNTEYLFSSRIRLHTNIGTIIKKRLETAGIEVWSNFFKSLRASCVTDLTNDPRIGENKATKWIGHSQEVSREAYQILKPEDAEYAAGVQRPMATLPPPTTSVGNGVESVTFENRLAEYPGFTVAYA